MSSKDTISDEDNNLDDLCESLKSYASTGGQAYMVDLVSDRVKQFLLEKLEEFEKTSMIKTEYPNIVQVYLHGSKNTWQKFKHDLLGEGSEKK